MSDVLASLSVKVTTPGFTAALKQIGDFADKSKAAATGASTLNSELSALTGTISKFTTQAKALSTAGTEMAKSNRSLSAVATRYIKLGDALGHYTKAAIAAKATGLPVPGVPGGGGGGGGRGAGSGIHGFLSASSSGIHGGILAPASAGLAAFAIAAGVAVGAASSVVGAMMDMGAAALQASMQIDQVKAAMHVVAGTEAGVAKELKFVEDTANRLALPLVETAMAYAKLGAAAGKSSAAQAAAKTAFIGVATAARAMHLSAGDTSGAIKALVDMMSKGQVMSEELKKQLGNRVPGAMRIAGDAAKDMGLDLNDALTKGLLKGDKALEFMSRFGERLKSEFGDAATKASTNFASGLIRIQNSMLQLGDRVANTGLKEGAGGVMTGISDGIRTMTKALEDFIASPAGQQFYDTLAATGTVIGQLISEFAGWASQTDDSKTLITLLREEIERLAPWMALLLQLAKNIGLQFKAWAQLKSGDLTGAFKTWGESQEALADIPKAMERAEQSVESQKQLRGVLRDMAEADAKWNASRGYATVVVEDTFPKTSVDKKAETLANRQREYLDNKLQEIAMEKELGKTTGETLRVFNELHKLKLASISNGVITTVGGKAGSVLADAQRQDALKTQEKENIASQKAATDRQKLLDKTYDSVKKISGVNNEAYENESLMVETLRMQKRISSEEALKYLDELKYKYDSTYAAAVDGETALAKGIDARIKSAKSKYGRGEDGAWAGNERLNVALAYSKGEISASERINALDSIARKTSETYKMLAETIDKSMGIAEDALVAFATTQITSWSQVRDGIKKMIGDILAEIARMLVRMLIMKPIMDSIRGMMSGGTSTGFDAMWAAMGARASGGPVSAGGRYTVGERGPETFIPGQSGMILPNGASGSAGSVTVVVNVDNKGNETSGSQAQSSGNGLADVIRGVVVDELYNQSRTGGHLWNMKYRGA